jgi:hypothetical protein
VLGEANAAKQRDAADGQHALNCRHRRANRHAQQTEDGARVDVLIAEDRESEASAVTKLSAVVDR